MVASVMTAEVTLWGEQVGAVTWLAERELGVFEYAPDFLKGDRDIAPLMMPLREARARRAPVFEFPGLDKTAFKGLPGLLADVLPDKFGNAVIDAWLARQQRSAASFNPVERLCYTGSRGMGALEFSPPISRRKEMAVPVEIARLTTLAQSIMQQRSELTVELGNDEQGNSEALMDIIRVGTSAGGARPKAVIAMDSEGNVRSGQALVPAGYDYWLLKFDGVDDLELGEPKGYGRIEYAYYQMAQAAGIDMAECRLLEENGRAHFMTRRFDRIDGEKIHMQSFCGIGHYDFNQAGAYGYEQVFEVMRRLRLPKAQAIQQYRRMLFNVLARNQDDHTKNISFLMDKDGRWRLSPAFDLIYAHNPQGQWTSQHQMTINGKRDNFTLEDLLTVAEAINLSRPQELIDEVADAVARWPQFARSAAVKPAQITAIAAGHRQLAELRR